MQKDYVLVEAEALKNFATAVFEKMDIPSEDAEITADVLVDADLRGVDSHGVARLSRYVKGLQEGLMFPHPEVKTLCETPSTALIDAGGGLGQPPSKRAMELAIQKAKEVGTGFVTVRNSNHYGIAGHYAMMALEEDMIGISMTNASPLVVPTFGRDAMLGTNPIAVAAPAGKEHPFVLDMATSTVPRGKLEVYNRLGEPLPRGWATDETGQDSEDTVRVLENINMRAGGGLLPLGGAGELLRGYKGYGLALWVEIFTAILPGAAYANLVYPKTPEGQPLPANLGHFFGAWQVEAFRPLEEFKASMDDLQSRLKDMPKTEGQERIYVPGEKEYEEAEHRSTEGIPLNAKVAANLQAIGEEMGVTYDL